MAIQYDTKSFQNHIRDSDERINNDPIKANDIV